MVKPVIDIKEMFNAGVHFGHLKNRWHPNMADYIHSVRGGRCIIDLEVTKTILEEILPIIEHITADDKKILLVGTKRQSKDIIKEAAQKIYMPYVVNRWVGGMLTNHKTINIQIKKLKELQKKMLSGELSNKYNKLEVLKYQKQIDNLQMLYGGIAEMGSLPSMVFIADMNINSIAISEANKLGIPIVAITDTNVNPALVTYPIPANDDAIKSIQYITDLIVSAIKNGQTKINSASLKKDETTKEESADE